MARSVFKIGFDKGLVNSKGPEENTPGELRTATGVYYKPGDDKRLHKLPGRSQLYPSGVIPDDAQAIYGLELIQFDNGSDYLLTATSGGYQYRNADPSLDQAFTPLTSGENSTGHVHKIHHDDRHFVVRSGIQNMVVEIIDGVVTTRAMGMGPPLPFSDSDVVATTSGSEQPPTGYLTSGNSTESSAENGGYTNGSLAYDSGPLTAAHSYINTGQEARLEVSGFPMIPSGSILEFTYSVGGEQHLPPWLEDWQEWKRDLYVKWRTEDDTFSSNVKLELDYGNGFGVIGDGMTWGVTEINFVGENPTSPHQLTIPIDLAEDVFRVKWTHTATGTSYFNAAFLHSIFDVKVRLAGDTGGFGSPDKEAFKADGFFYGYAEYDSTRGLQGPARWMTSGLSINGLVDTPYNSVTWTLPAGGPVNPIADQYIVYRTAQNGVPPQDLGEFTLIDIPSDSGVRPVVIDTFTEWDEETQPVPLYEVLEVTLPNGTSLPFELYQPPEPAKFITTYQKSIVTVPSNETRKIRYSEPGEPDWFPLIYEFSKLSLPENDQIVALVPVSRALIILMKEAVLALYDLPFVSEETFTQAEPNQLEGIPGCVGDYAATPMSMTGEPAAAWVSRHGIYLCDGAIAASITEDLDWENMVSKTNLSTSVLTWDQERDLLVFAYDSDGSGVNNRYILGHLNERHIKGAVFGRFPLPKWTGPHYGSFMAMAEGEVADIYQVYTAHPSDGNVYVEWSGVVDDSQSASGVYPGAQADIVPTLFNTGKMFTEDYTEVMPFKLSLRHNDWGTDRTAIVSTTFKRDQNQAWSGVVSKTVSLNKERGTEFFLGRQAETFEFKVQHTTSGTGSFTDLRGISRKSGPAGSR